jgi:hypothetical protein
MREIYPVYIFLLDVISLIISQEEYTLLQLLPPFYTKILNTLTLRPSLDSETKFRA